MAKPGGERGRARGGGRGGYGGDRRRGRSPSPGGRGSPPPHFKRMRGDNGGYDRMWACFKGGPYRDGPYDRPPPFDDRFDRGPYDERPPFAEARGYRDRPPSPPPGRPSGPRSFKSFMMDQPDAVTPQEARQAYDRYLLDYWGSARVKEFQDKKEHPRFRAKFDPRQQAVQQEERNKEAQGVAESFFSAVGREEIDPTADDFNQGGTAPNPDADKPEGSSSKPNGKHKEPVRAPTVCWSRIEQDLKLSRRLIAKLDAEKGITWNPLLQLGGDKGAAAAGAGKKEDAAGKKEDAAGKKEDAAGKKEDETMPDAAAPGAAGEEGTATDGAEPQAAATDAVAEAMAEDGAAATPLDAVEAAAGVEAGAERQLEPAVQEKLTAAPAAALLDLQLTYLWRVHRVNYYVGGEWWDPTDVVSWRKGERMLRAPQLEEGEAPDPEKERADAARVKQMVDDAWQQRIAGGDPLDALIHRDKVEAEVEQWIVDQVRRHDDKKWGSTLSAKMFVGRDFVLKHIKVKHTGKVEEARSRILERLFWENYDAYENSRRALELQEAAGEPLDGDAIEAEYAEPADARGSGFPSLDRGRTGRGGRGGRGPPAGGMRPLVPAIISPEGQGLVLAPGGVEGQGPYIPIDAVPSLEPGGPRGVRGPPRGGPGMGRGGGRGARSYGAPAWQNGRAGGYRDLDEPANQRPLLDYGDL